MENEIAMQTENKSETRGRHIYKGLLGLGPLGGSEGFSEQVGYRVLLNCVNSLKSSWMIT